MYIIITLLTCVAMLILSFLFVESIGTFFSKKNLWLTKKQSTIGLFIVGIIISVSYLLLSYNIEKVAPHMIITTLEENNQAKIYETNKTILYKFNADLYTVDKNTIYTEYDNPTDEDENMVIRTKYKFKSHVMGFVYGSVTLDVVIVNKNKILKL